MHTKKALMNQGSNFGTHVLHYSCVHNRNTFRHFRGMKEQSTLAEVNIHPPARPQDRKLIDRAAELAGVNRSQFMLASALKEAKNILLDQSAIFAGAKTFADSTPKCNSDA
jgi:uncharacterized protein (DUF1778 family)